MNRRLLQVTPAILALILFVTTCAPTVTPAPGWTVYTTKDGLANLNVHSIAVSSDGAL
jgi:hypothetical protein